MLGRTCFYTDTKEFYKFYKDKMNTLKYEPNITHKYIKKLEKDKNITVITQNIDGLHQAAGSRNVLELHGTLHRAYCSACGKPFSAEEMENCEGVPRCSCGGVIRPDIVLYEESLDDKVLRASVNYIRNADVLIVGGTSLNVYPAAGLINYYNGHKLVLINRSATPYDEYADLIIHANIGYVFSQV